MSLLKYIDRLKKMDDLIRRKGTGTSIEFAEKLNISRSVLMENLSEIRSLGAQIKYCMYAQSYYYENEFQLIIGPRKENQIRGGCGPTVSVGLIEFSEYL